MTTKMAVIDVCSSYNSHKTTKCMKTGVSKFNKSLKFNRFIGNYESEITLYNHTSLFQDFSRFILSLVEICGFFFELWVTIWELWEIHNILRHFLALFDWTKIVDFSLDNLAMFGRLDWILSRCSDWLYKSRFFDPFYLFKLSIGFARWWGIQLQA